MLLIMPQSMRRSQSGTGQVDARKVFPKIWSRKTLGDDMETRLHLVKYRGADDFSD